MWGVVGEPDELHPADVATGVAYLVFEACTDSGWILHAANGQFHATKAIEAVAVNYPRDIKAIKATSPDEIAAKWSQIALATIEPRALNKG